MDELEEEGPTKADLERIGREWIDRILASEKREKDWMDAAEEAEDAYLVAKKEGKKVPDFNILHSNVETIVPAIYNSTPRPEIRPRHNNREDTVAKQVADIYERAITALIDDNRLDREIEQGAQDAFMAGRGIVRIRFDADDVTDPMTGQVRIENERVLYENVAWKDYREGSAKRWDAMPWVAYGHDVSEEEKERLENPELAAQFENDPHYADKKDQEKDCRVWEIWCKETRRVYFVIQDSCRVLDIIDDPLGLEEFFPQGEPVQPITGTGRRTPVCPYTVYKALAEELDTATKRINAIMKGLKVRGAIAGDAEILEIIAELGDNELAPVPNLENLVAAGGLEKAVLWWPIEMAVNVIAQLYQQREMAKQSIYEITGISDIVRGAGQASETATASNIKTQWGSLRIKKMQNMLVRQVRDLFCLTAEVIAKQISPETIQKLSGIPLTPETAQLVKQWDRYRIDVESDSTIRADATKNREEMGQFLLGTGQFMAAMQPLVMQSPKAAGPVAKLFAAFATQFNLGKAGEDALEEMIKMAEEASQQPQQPSPEQMKEEREAKMDEERFKLETQQFQLEAMKAKAEHGIDVQTLEIKRDEVKIKEAEAEINAAEKLIYAEDEPKEGAK